MYPIYKYLLFGTEFNEHLDTLYIIFRFLRKRELISCRSVCKVFYLSSWKQYCQNIKFKHTSLHKVKPFYSIYKYLVLMNPQSRSALIKDCMAKFDVYYKIRSALDWYKKNTKLYLNDDLYIILSYLSFFNTKIEGLKIPKIHFSVEIFSLHLNKKWKPNLFQVNTFQIYHPIKLYLKNGFGNCKTLIFSCETVSISKFGICPNVEILKMNHHGKSDLYCQLELHKGQVNLKTWFPNLKHLYIYTTNFFDIKNRYAYGEEHWTNNYPLCDKEFIKQRIEMKAHSNLKFYDKVWKMIQDQGIDIHYCIRV